MEKMEQLASIIKDIEVNNSINKTEFLNSVLPEEQTDLLDDLLCDLFIDYSEITNLKPNFKNITKFEKEFGYCIKKGDSDSFGWVSGALHTTKGVYYFG